MRVEQMLREYPQKKARLETLKIRLEGLKDDIQQGYGIEETDTDTIEGMTFASSRDGMPRAHNNSSPTERVAENYRKEQERLKKPIPASLFLEKRSLESQIRHLETDVAQVDAMMIALSAEEKLIIQKFYLERMPWRFVVEAYRERFGIYKELRTLHDIKNRALEIMEKIIA